MMNEFTIYCTSEQTKKALELGAPILEECLFNPVSQKCALINPTAEQMIGYLRTRGFKFSFDDIYNYWAVSVDCKIIDKGQSEDKELSAIAAALKYLNEHKLLK